MKANDMEGVENPGQSGQVRTRDGVKISPPDIIKQEYPNALTSTRNS